MSNSVSSTEISARKAKRNQHVEQIENIAEDYIRVGGFKAFSFREISKQIGIKSSSIHYHFPTKADLAATVARRYTQRFMQAIGDANDRTLSPKVLLNQYVKTFENAATKDKKMCLCGALAAEANDLPDAVKYEAQQFFKQNLSWLVQVYARLFPDAVAELHQQKALLLLGSLEGAMLVAQVMDEPSHFTTMAAGLLLD